jgi:hypothetical protein
MGGVLSKPISSAITAVTGAKTYGDAVKQIQGTKPIEESAGAEKKQEEAKEVNETKRLLRVKRKGRSSTVLSSSSGVTDEASVSKKTLLGA